MKLIPLIVLTVTFAVDVKTQKFRHEQFPFPPQFQSAGPNLFSSDSSLYLPPESHQPVPYFPIKNVNNLQFPFLPPTGTKAPSVYPTPFPLMISSTLVPHFEDDDDDDNNYRHSTSKPIQQKMNKTEKVPDMQQLKENREMRPAPKSYFQHPIDRIDVKFPQTSDVKFPPVTLRPIALPLSSTPTPVSQTAPVRRFLNTETHRNDFGVDQIKAGSLHGNPFIAAPGLSGVYISSSTEPAIPILRLSNEMDLDGSFSYEALGADQTHYVQHSRMENMGTEKEEQVVEGSYSYVGDNGQTYTVHYIADANGFRASGDHLPVAPPVPEIIQRSVQYNLAEEAKRPAHLKSWQDDGRDNQIRDTDQHPQFVSPPRLFTGRTPEAFSYSYNSQANPQNNLVTSATSQSPVKTVELTTEQIQIKPNNGPIAPQITFLASQGAHVPNTIQNSISRMFASEKSPSGLPKLVNYEAALQDSEQENNKALWRWQYGLNSNNLQQNQNRDTISRSSGEGDDVLINFSDMTPEQYTTMIRSQLDTQDVGVDSDLTRNEPIRKTKNNYYPDNNDHVKKLYQNVNNNIKPSYSTTSENIPSPLPLSSERPITSEEWYKSFNNVPVFPTTLMPLESRDIALENKPNIITHKDFIHPPSTTVTQSYDFEETDYEPKRIRALNTNNKMSNENNLNVIPLNNNGKPYEQVSDIWAKENDIKTTTKQPLSNFWGIGNEMKTTTAQTLATIWEKENVIKTTAANIFSDFWIKENEMKTTSEYPIDFWTKDSEIKTTTQEPLVNTGHSIKFTDFIVNENKNNFRPITTTTEAPRDNPTTKNGIESIKENLFLQKLFNTGKSEPQIKKIISQKPPQKILQIKIEAEPKADPIQKYIPPPHKQVNEIKNFKKQPLSIADVFNYISMKNAFEPIKTKAKSKSIHSDNSENKNAIRYIPMQQDQGESVVRDAEVASSNVKILKHELKDELRGTLKNYKILQRNNNSNNKYDTRKELTRELSPPPLQTSLNLPPLGRAGPSMKTYLPPVYV